MKDNQNAVSAYINESLKLLREDREKLEVLSRELGTLTQSKDQADKANSNLQAQLTTSENNYKSTQSALEDSLAANQIYLAQNRRNESRIKELITRVDELEKQERKYVLDENGSTKDQTDQNQNDVLKDALEAAYGLIGEKNKQIAELTARLEKPKEKV